MVPKILWKTSIETYYDVNTQVESIREEVLSELDGILKKCGADIIKHEMEEILADEMDRECMVFNPIFRANFRSGLWEIEILSTHQLDVPPEYQKRFYR